MIMYKITCNRCGKTWEEGIEEHQEKKLKYRITKYNKSASRIDPGGKYETVYLCPECMEKLEQFLNGGVETDLSGSCGYYAAYVEGDPHTFPVIIGSGAINGFLNTGYKVVTLESYVKSKNNKGE